MNQEKNVVGGNVSANISFSNTDRLSPEAIKDMAQILYFIMYNKLNSGNGDWYSDSTPRFRPDTSVPAWWKEQICQRSTTPHVATADISPNEVNAYFGNTYGNFGHSVCTTTDMTTNSVTIFIYPYKDGDEDMIFNLKLVADVIYECLKHHESTEVVGFSFITQYTVPVTDESEKTVDSGLGIITKNGIEWHLCVKHQIK